MNEREMLERAEMRWMSVEDAEITVSARALALLGRRAVRAEAALREIVDYRWMDVSAHNAMRGIARAAIAEGLAEGLAEDGTPL